MSTKVLGTAVYPIEINDEITVTADIDINAGVTSSAEYDVDSVTLGDFIDIAILNYNSAGTGSWEEPVAGVVFSARVSQNGKVRVSITNTTGGNLIPAVPKNSKILVKVRVRADGSLPALP